MHGLDPLLAECRGLSLLDVGCNNGSVAAAFAEAGAGPIAGFDFHPPSVAAARDLLPGANIFAHDLTQGAPASRADIVLYLGVHHHLHKQCSNARDVAKALMRQTNRYFAARAPIIHLTEIEAIASEIGLKRWIFDNTSNVVSPLTIFAQVTAS